MGVHPAAQAYLTRLQAAGKSKREALRVLKRRLVRVVFTCCTPISTKPNSTSRQPPCGSRTGR
jgi:hypothetical protein